MSLIELTAPPRSKTASARSDPAHVLRRLRDAVDEIQAGAQALDQLGAFPTSEVVMLHELGALSAFVLGDPTPLQTFEALRLVGRANLSLGRIFEGHVNGAKLVDWYGDDGQRRRLRDDLESGALYGVWNTEPTPGVTITLSGMLQGRKSYATGAGFVKRAIVTGADPRGHRQMVIADGAISTRADLSTWKVSGMRATCSGAYDLTGLPADSITSLGGPNDYVREPRFSAGAWRFTAVQLGGAERILTLIRQHLAESATDVSPIQAARFGSAVASVRSAYLWVREAALRVEAADCGADEIAFVLMTRGVVEAAGLEVMEAASRAVGTKGFFEDHPLDQACRDLALYLRQPVPDQALERSARAFLVKDCWLDDPLW